MAAVVSRVVPAGAIEASEEMAFLLRLLGVLPNSRSGDAKDGRVSSVHDSVFVRRKSMQDFPCTPVFLTV